MDEKEKLKKSEALFRSYFNLPMHGIAVISPEKEWVEVNDRICSMCGYSRDEIFRMTWFEMIHPDDIAGNLEQFNRVLSGQIDHYNMDKRFIRKDGQILWANLSVGSVRKPDGSLDNIIVVVEDITDRKQVETALITSEERFYKIFQSSPAPIYISSISDGRYIDVNKSGLQLLGYTREEMIGHTAQELGIWHTFSEREHILRKLTAHNSIHNEPILFRTKNGEVKETLLSFEIIRLGHEDVMLSLVHDITERRQAEDALRKSEEKYRTLIETTDTGFVVIDQNGIVQDANSEYVRLTGHHDLNEIIGRSVLDWTLDDEKKKSLAEIGSFFEKGYIRNLEINHVTANGEIIPIEINATRVEMGGETRALTMCRDITDRRRTERELRENEERLRGITENLPGVIFQFYARDNGEYGMSYISEPLDSFSKIIVGDDAANLDTFFSSLVPRVYEEDREAFLASIKTAVETVTPWNFEGRIALPSGMMVWFQGLSVPERHEDRLVFNGIILNITERKLAEDALHHKTALLEAQLNSTIDGILVVDMQGKIVLQNQRTIDLWKIPQNIADSEDDQMQVQYVMYMTVNPEQFVEKVTYLYNHPDETTRDEVELKDGTFLDRYSAPVLDKDGKNYGRIWIFRDITERKRAEEELRARTKDLEEANTALKVLLNQLEKGRNDLEERILSNIRELVLPYVNNLRHGKLSVHQVSLVDTIESNLDRISSSFLQNLKLNFYNLTPREIEIANLVKEGRSIKEIAELLGVTEKTVEFHRSSLRNKLGLKNKKANLRSHLLNI